MATSKENRQNGTTVRIRSGNYPDYMTMVLPGAGYRDLVFRCSDGDLYAHRIVLASVSRLLAYSFNDQMPGETTVISLPDIQASVMSHLLDLAYTGTTFIKKYEIREFRNTCLLLDFVSLEAQDGVRVEGSLKLVDLNSADGSFWGVASPTEEYESLASAFTSSYVHTPRDQSHYAKENTPEDFDFGNPIIEIGRTPTRLNIEQSLPPGSDNCVPDKSSAIPVIGDAGLTNKQNEASSGSKEKAGIDSVEKSGGDGDQEVETKQLDLECISSDENEVILISSTENVKTANATDNSATSSVGKENIANVSPATNTGGIDRTRTGELQCPGSSESKSAATDSESKVDSPVKNPEKKKPVCVSISSSSDEEEEEEVESEEVEFLEEFDNSKSVNLGLKPAHEAEKNKPGASAPNSVPTKSSRGKRNRVDNTDSDAADDYYENPGHPSHNHAPNVDGQGQSIPNNKRLRFEESTTEFHPRNQVDTKTNSSSGGWIDLSNKRTTQFVPGVIRPTLDVPQFSDAIVMNPKFQQPSDSADPFKVNNASSQNQPSTSTSAFASLPIQRRPAPADAEFESSGEDGEIFE